MAWLRDMVPPPPPVEPTQPLLLEGEFVEIEGHDPLEDLLAEIGKSAENNYSSDDMEADFQIAIELMMECGVYLKILGDINRRFGVLSESREKEFREHVEKVEEFTGQWG